MEDIDIGGADGTRLIVEWIRGELSPDKLRNESHEAKLSLVAAILQGVKRVCEDAGYEVSVLSAFDAVRGNTPTGALGIQFVVGNTGAFVPSQFGSVVAPVYPGVPQSEVLSGTLKILSVPVEETVTRDY